MSGEVWKTYTQEKLRQEDRKRPRVAQKLGVPEDYKEWTTEHKRRFIDSGVLWIHGWPYVWEVRASLKEDQAESESASQGVEGQAKQARPQTLVLRQ